MEAEINNLRAKIVKLESDSRTASQLGLEMLSENDTLKQEISQLKHGKGLDCDIELLKEANHVMKKRLETKEHLEREMDAEIQGLQTELKKRSSAAVTKQELEEVRKRYETAYTKNQALEREVEVLRENKKNWKLELEELRKEVQRRRSRVVDDSLLSSPANSTANELRLEVARLANEKEAMFEELDVMKELYNETKERLNQVEQELTEWKDKAEYLNSASKEFQEQAEDAKNELEVLRTSHTELMAEKVKPTQKGNSMYAELDVQRLKVEEQYLSLHKKYEDAAGEKKKLEKEMEGWKRRFITQLHADANSTVSTEQLKSVEEELDRTRRELRLERARKVQQLERNLQPLSSTPYGSTRPTHNSSNVSFGSGSDVMQKEQIDNLRHVTTLKTQLESLQLQRASVQDELIQEQKKRHQMEERVKEKEKEKDMLRMALQEHMSNAKSQLNASVALRGGHRPKIKLNKEEKEGDESVLEESLSGPSPLPPLSALPPPTALKHRLTSEEKGAGESVAEKKRGVSVSSKLTVVDGMDMVSEESMKEQREGEGRRKENRPRKPRGKQVFTASTHNSNQQDDPDTSVGECKTQ